MNQETKRPTYKVKDTQHATRVVPEHERRLIENSPYSGGRVIDR